MKTQPKAKGTTAAKATEGKFTVSLLALHRTHSDVEAAVLACGKALTSLLSPTRKAREAALELKGTRASVDETVAVKGAKVAVAIMAAIFKGLTFDRGKAFTGWQKLMASEFALMSMSEGWTAEEAKIVERPWRNLVAVAYYLPAVTAEYAKGRYNVGEEGSATYVPPLQEAAKAAKAKANGGNVTWSNERAKREARTIRRLNLEAIRILKVAVDARAEVLEAKARADAKAEAKAGKLQKAPALA